MAAAPTRHTLLNQRRCVPDPRVSGVLSTWTYPSNTRTISALATCLEAVFPSLEMGLQFSAAKPKPSSTPCHHSSGALSLSSLALCLQFQFTAVAVRPFVILWQTHFPTKCVWWSCVTTVHVHRDILLVVTLRTFLIQLINNPHSHLISLSLHFVASSSHIDQFYQTKCSAP